MNRDTGFIDKMGFPIKIGMIKYFGDGEKKKRYTVIQDDDFEYAIASDEGVVEKLNEELAKKLINPSFDERWETEVVTKLWDE